MDLIKNVLAQKKSELTAALIAKAGFGAEQAETFVPAATESVVDAVKGESGLDPAALAGSAPADLIGKIDIGALASKVGIDPGMATAGLTSIVPMILSALQGKLGNLGAAGNLAAGLGGGEGGLAGAAKSMGGLLKR